MRVLIVEDERLIAKAARNMLRSRHEVTEVGAMRDAIATLQQGHAMPDVVVLDLTLPDSGNPEETYWRMRQVLPRDVPIIVISGSIPEGLRRWLRQTGAYRVVDKPFTQRELVDAVESSQEGRGSDPPPRDSNVEYLAMQMVDKFSVLMQAAYSNMRDDVMRIMDERDKKNEGEFSRLKRELFKVKTLLGWKPTRDTDAPPPDPDSHGGDDELVLKFPRSLRARMSTVNWVKLAMKVGLFVGVAMASAVVAYNAARNQIQPPKIPAPQAQAAPAKSAP